MADTIEFPEWAPDVSGLVVGTSLTISGVVPQADGYGPFQDCEDFTSMLASYCRGYFFARRSDGSIAVFAGTATDLYLLDNTSFTWTNVSKGGVPYSALVADANWRFAQFNDLVLAVQSNTVPQKYILSSSTDFVDLGGSPPQAGHIAIVNRFVVLTALLANPRRVHWCDLDAPEVWTAGTGLADFQDLPDGGTVFGCSGGDAYGVIFQNESIRSLIYAPGSAVTFRIVRISTQDTLFGEYSVINAGDKTFFCSAQGFKVIEAGGLPKPIGKERVDRTFFADVDKSNLQLFQGATDPTATRVYWAYKSVSGAGNEFDKILVYDWSIGNNGRWSLLPMSGQFITALARPGLTLEQMDAIAPTQLTVSGAANNGAGLIRLTLNALSNADFTVVGQNFIVVQGVVGTTEANGTWPITVIDATHIDLVGSAFSNAYVSGGKIGGSLDALTFSLDSISRSAVASLSMVSPTGAMCFFTGENLEAILETAEQDLKGRTVFISGSRPMTDSPDAMVSIAGRMNGQSATAFGTERAISVYDGLCPARIETRYAKARMRIPAGSIWTYAKGVQPEADLAGER